MARARNIKPSFFLNEDLGQADPLLSLLFISLWTLADKDGKLEDRPLRIKAETFPYRENIDINGYLTQLVALGLIERYEVLSDNKNIKVIRVVKFKKHQSPHSTEKSSVLPDRPAESPEKPIVERTSVRLPLSNESASVDPDINVLIPDSSNTDSLIPDSLIPEKGSAPKKSSRPAKKHPPEKNTTSELQDACRETWRTYSAAYFDRYGAEPVRNAKVSSVVKQFVQRLGYHESPHVAAHYVRSNNGYYVSRAHVVDCMLADAEKLRTEWATGQAMTQTKARQIDKSAANLDAVQDAMALLEDEG